VGPGVCSAAVSGNTSTTTIIWTDEFETNPFDGIGGTWQVDNSQAVAGTRAIHPPLKTGTGGVDNLTTSCGGASHSQLSFYYTGRNPTAGQQLKFFVDNSLYATYGQTLDCCNPAWRNVKLVLPTGTHSYRWEASTDVAGQAPYWIDSIQCTDASVVRNTSATFGFEEGFVAPEVGTDFQIDNTNAQTGAFAVHPPILGAGQTATVNFACGCKEHSELSFYYTGRNPGTGQQLKFFVDGALYATYGQTLDCCNPAWRNVDVFLPKGPHTYRWETSTPGAGQPPFWLDTIQCK
jgi:hypothetical protein